MLADTAEVTPTAALNDRLSAKTGVLWGDFEGRERVRQEFGIGG